MIADRAKKLYGPTIQYADGRVVTGKALDVTRILSEFERSDSETRRIFLSVFAHDLTVATRVFLQDRPIPDVDLNRVWKINEFMHQLTSCVNPRGDWSAHDEAALVRSIIETSFSYELDQWIGHALAVAAENTFQARKTAAAK